jgi:hypothetical protein
MRIPNTSLNISAIATITLLSGCASPQVQMYSGPEKPNNEQAIIRVDKGAGRLGILSIDNQNTVDALTFFFNGQKWASTAKVLPGRHTISTRLDYRMQYSISNLWWEAQAGEKYIIKAKPSGYSVQFWIENESTHERVGGVNVE